MTCAQCQGWMLEERRVDFSPDTFVWRCIHCASIADPMKDSVQSSPSPEYLLLEAGKVCH